MLCSMLYPSSIPIHHHYYDDDLAIVHQLAMQERRHRQERQRQQRQRELAAAAAYAYAYEQARLRQQCQLEQQQRQKEEEEAEAIRQAILRMRRQQRAVQYEATLRHDIEKERAMEQQRQHVLTSRALAQSQQAEAEQRRQKEEKEARLAAEKRALQKAAAEAKQREAAAQRIQRQWRAYQAVQSARTSLPALAAIKKVRDDVSLLLSAIDNEDTNEMHAVYDTDRQRAILPFVDGPNKLFLTTEEQLLKHLIQLDAIEISRGDAEMLRAHRKALVRRIDHALSRIEAKKQDALQKVAATPTPATPSKETLPLQPSPVVSERDDLEKIDMALATEEAVLRKAIRGLKQRRRYGKAKKSNKVCRLI